MQMQLLTTTFLLLFIHEDSNSENRDNGSFSIISLTECQEALSERQFVKKNVWHLLCLELTFAHKVLVLLPTRIGDFTNFFQDISSDN